jgi:CheY-like chemotaxis protein
MTSDSPLQDKLILVVDDEPDVLETIQDKFFIEFEEELRTSQENQA